MDFILPLLAALAEVAMAFVAVWYAYKAGGQNASTCVFLLVMLLFYIETDIKSEIRRYGSKDRY